MKKSSKFYAMIILIVALLVMIGYYLHNNQSKRIDMDLQGSLVRLDSHVLTVYNVRNFNDYETIDLHSIAKKFDSAIRYVAYNNEALYLLLEEKDHTWRILRITVNVNIRMYNFDDVQCTVIPSVAYGFVTGMNLQLC